MGDLERLAELIAVPNSVAKEIAAIVGRPALVGHLGEFIASHVFDIELEESATVPGVDGHFCTGRLAGKSVNVKGYPKREGLMDLKDAGGPDYYLGLAGPRRAAISSRGSTRPWVVDSVYMFDSEARLATLRERGVKIGVATSVAEPIWAGAEVHPASISDDLRLSAEQVELLSMFGSERAGG